MIMMMMSAINNLSRSAGYAMLATQEPLLVVLFIVGEMAVFLVGKMARRDFLYWVPIEGAAGLVVSFLVRVVGKTIVDFTGCIHFRHPTELGGAAFAASVLWAQAFPIVALQLYDGEEGIKRSATIFFVSSFVVWVLLAITLSRSIDLRFAKTFYSMQTGAQFIVERFVTSDSDLVKFDAIFMNRLSFTKPIHEEVKGWVAGSIERWRVENEEWFEENLIPKEMLPNGWANGNGAGETAAPAGARSGDASRAGVCVEGTNRNNSSRSGRSWSSSRRRSSISFKELAGGGKSDI